MKTMTRECADPQCDRVYLPEGVTVVADAETGALFCDAMCHHSFYYGVRPPITQAEELALEKARTWMREHRS